MGYNPVKAAVESGVASTVLGPVGSAIGANAGAKNLDPVSGAKDLAATMGAYNPYRKPGIPDAYNPVMPPPIVAPVLNPKGGAPLISHTTVGTVKGPTAAQINAVPQNQFRDAEMALVDQLSDQAKGIGPSVAENNFRSATDANLAATLAAANSSRGGANPALMKAALESNAQVQGRMAQDVATAKLQEQLAAQGLLGQVAGQGRGADIGLARDQAGLQQQATLAGYQGNLDLTKTQAGITANEAIQNQQSRQDFNRFAMEYQRMGMSAQEADQMAWLQIQQMINGNTNATNAQTLAGDIAQKHMVAGLIKDVGGALATGGASMGSPAAAPAAAAPAPTGNVPQAASPYYNPYAVYA